MIVLDVRRAIAVAVAESGWDPATEPKLRPAGEPGTYASSIALSLVAAAGKAAGGAAAGEATAGEAAAGRQGGRSALDVARTLARRLADEDWIARATVSGDGFVTVTVTPQFLASVTARITAAAAGCVSSEVLRGVTVAPMPAADLAGAATWEDARAALAAELAATLAVAAGATVAAGPAVTAGATVAAGPAAPFGATVAPAETAAPGLAAPLGAPVAPGATVAPAETAAPGPTASPGVPVAPGAIAAPAATVAFAGADAVRFALARAIPGKPVRVDPISVARNSLDNPAYAVRYAHARAASGVRWAAALAKPGEAALPCLPADPADWALLDALSWLPERVAVAARRGRPDELARYLEGLASATIAALPFVGPADGERLALIQATAQAARTALAAGLGLLGVAAPDRL